MSILLLVLRLSELFEDSTTSVSGLKETILGVIS